MFPAGVAPAACRFANGRASVAPRERKEVVRYASAALALSGWKPDVLAVTPIPRMVGNDRSRERGLVVRPSYPVFFAWTCLRAPLEKRPPELELHRPRRVFSALLICLSYLARDKNGRTPRCCAGLLLIPNQAGTLAPSCPEKNWLPDMDSNHDNRCNRPAGCLTSSGNEKFEPSGTGPQLAAVY